LAAATSTIKTETDAAPVKMGLVTKTDTSPGFEMVKMPMTNSAQPLPLAPQMPFGGQINPQALFGPQSIFGPGGINPAQLLQQTLDYGSLGGSLFNPFLMASASNLPNGSIMQQLMSMGGWGAMGAPKWPKPEMKGAFEEEEAAEEEDEMGVAETYADYMPSKCNLDLIDFENKILISLKF
jgi:hypothetical protein